MLLVYFARYNASSIELWTVYDQVLAPIVLQ